MIVIKVTTKLWRTYDELSLWRICDDFTIVSIFSKIGVWPRRRLSVSKTTKWCQLVAQQVVTEPNILYTLLCYWSPVWSIADAIYRCCITGRSASRGVASGWPSTSGCAQRPSTTWWRSASIATSPSVARSATPASCRRRAPNCSSLLSGSCRLSSAFRRWSAGTAEIPGGRRVRLRQESLTAIELNVSLPLRLVVQVCGSISSILFHFTCRVAQKVNTAEVSIDHLKDCQRYKIFFSFY